MQIWLSVKLGLIAKLSFLNLASLLFKKEICITRYLYALKVLILEHIKFSCFKYVGKASTMI